MNFKPSHFHLWITFTILGGSESFRGNLSRVKRFGGVLAGSYELPWMCTINMQNNWNQVVAGCTILQQKWILASPSRLNDDDIHRNINLSHYQSEKEWFNFHSHYPADVLAGHNHMAPTAEDKDPSRPNHVQPCAIQNIYAVVTAKIVGEQHPSGRVKWKPEKTADLLRTGDYLPYEICAFKFEFLIIKLEQHFFWSPFILPIPILHKLDSDDLPTLPQITESIEKFEQVLNETVRLNPTLCIVSSWSRTGHFQRRFLQVSWVSMNKCREAYCSVYPKETCLVFPAWGDMCFKAIWYGDVCDTDQGQALYCRDYESGSILGFVKKSINCGFQRLPVVYTPLDQVMEVWMSIAGHFVYLNAAGEDMGKRVDYNDKRYLILKETEEDHDFPG